MKTAQNWTIIDRAVDKSREKCLTCGYPITRNYERFVSVSNIFSRGDHEHIIS